MNNAISEIKNTLEATNSRLAEAEDRITPSMGFSRQECWSGVLASP